LESTVAIPDAFDVVIIGGGFTGLAAACQLTRHGHKVVVLERDSEVGGLASSFRIGNTYLEKFYHHWFTSDVYIMSLMKDLGLENKLVLHQSITGSYYGKIYTLSSPLDIMHFTPLTILERLRLGLLVLRAKSIKDWQKLDSLSAEEWLCEIGGIRVYEVVWEPLLKGKFGSYAKEISAAWFWSKLKLRGGSRSKSGAETLAYCQGGFALLADRMVKLINSSGGVVLTGDEAVSLEVIDNKITGVLTKNGIINCTAVISTQALPLVADMLEPHVDKEYLNKLHNIKYLANICLVLELKHRLSNIYWLNINNINFPYVGVIEHTNFESAETYQGRHIVYLSKYLPESDDFYRLNDEDIYNFSLPHIKSIFPAFDASWVLNYHVWRAKYAQPLVVRNYNQTIPLSETPLKGFYISTMAQVYPEDRGVNYAIRNGLRVSDIVSAYLEISDKKIY
jgi:protoporphyrinogen oxidase